MSKRPGCPKDLDVRGPGCPGTWVSGDLDVRDLSVRKLSVRELNVCESLNPCIPCLHRKLPCPGTAHPLSRTAVKTYALARHCSITKLDLPISIETFWSVCGLSSLVLSVVCFSFVPVLSGLLYLPFSHHREGSIDFNTVNIHRTVGRDVFLDIFTPNRDQSVTFVRI